MRSLVLAAVTAIGFTAGADAATILPLDRATILVGSPFDFKVEFEGRRSLGDVRITINGADYRTLLGTEAGFVAAEQGKDGQDLGSAVLLRGVTLAKPGRHGVEATAGNDRKTVTWGV